MEKSSTVFFLLYLIFSSFTLISCAPKPQSDADDNNGDILPKFIDQSLDYNAMMNNFKDFFMYLPVMMTSFRESMSGFPKFAEGIRILTAPTLEKVDDDCKCKTKAIPPPSNAIDKNMDIY